jgi:peptide/nickel transport system permease protein
VKKTRLVIQRLWQMVPVLLAISVITFVLAQAIPGDPIRLIVGPRAPQSVIDEVRHNYGLDRPVLLQYFVYLGNLVQGDWGQSIAFRSPVLDLIRARLPTTLSLLGGGLVMSVLMAFVLSVLAARNENRWVDQLVRLFSTVALGLPAFWLGLVLLLIFAVRLGWLPATGRGQGFVDGVRHLVLPWITVGIVMTPILVRNLRATLIERSKADLVVAVRSKGIRERSVFLDHVLPNSILPNLHLLGIVTVYILGISIVIEPIFALPGLGQLYIGSIISRDYFAIQGLTLVFALLTALTTLSVDVLSLVVDPRIER